MGKNSPFLQRFLRVQIRHRLRRRGLPEQRILHGGEEERKRYIRFLSRGSSAYSLDILREAGVDMTSPVPLEQTLRSFREKTALLEGLLEL